MTAETECTFSYCFRPKTQIDLSDLTEVPFQVCFNPHTHSNDLLLIIAQVQLVYTKLNGMKCLRVATASIQVTEDRKEAEKNANLTVIGTHAAQRAAKYAKEGEFERAQMEARAAQRFMSRNASDDAENAAMRSVWSRNVAQMDDALRDVRRGEKEKGVEGDKEARRQALKQNDGVAVIVTKTKVANTNKLFK